MINRLHVYNQANYYAKKHWHVEIHMLPDKLRRDCISQAKVDVEGVLKAWKLGTIEIALAVLDEENR